MAQFDLEIDDEEIQWEDIAPTEPDEHSNMRLDLMTREAQLLGRGNRRSEGWRGLLSRQIANSDDDDLGTFIAVHAALSNPEPEAPRPAQPSSEEIAEAQSQHEHDEEQRTRTRRRFVNTCCIICLIPAVIIGVLLSHAVSPWICLDSIMGALCIILSSLAACAFIASTMAHKINRPNTTAIALPAIIGGLALGALSLGAPPLTALMCWLAWTEMSDLLEAEGARITESSSDRRRGERRRFFAPNQNAPRYAEPARNRAEEMRDEEGWVGEVSQLILDADDQDLGTLLAGYVVLESIRNQRQDDTDEEDDPLTALENDEAERNLATAETRFGTRIGLALGGLGALDLVLRFSALEPATLGLCFLVLLIAGGVSGRRFARTFSRFDGARVPEAFPHAIAYSAWRAFWVVYFLYLAMFAILSMGNVPSSW